MMNKRMDDIAFQAGCYRSSRYDPDHPAGNGWIIDQATLERFAEAIVNECCDVVTECDTDPKMILHEPHRTIVREIQLHFQERD